MTLSSNHPNLFPMWCEEFFNWASLCSQNLEKVLKFCQNLGEYVNVRSRGKDMGKYGDILKSNLQPAQGSPDSVFFSHMVTSWAERILILPYNQCLHVVIMPTQLVLACFKALLSTKSNPASIKERAEVFPPGWCVEALQTSSFCYSASVGSGIIVLQIVLLE